MRGAPPARQAATRVLSLSGEGATNDSSLSGPSGVAGSHRASSNGRGSPSPTSSGTNRCAVGQFLGVSGGVGPWLVPHKMGVRAGECLYRKPTPSGRQKARLCPCCLPS